MASKTESQKKSQRDYMSKQDLFQIRMEKGKKEVIEAHAEARGESMNKFINRAIDEAMERDGKNVDTD